jgi:hypothetical protein
MWSWQKAKISSKYIPQNISFISGLSMVALFAVLSINFKLPTEADFVCIKLLQQLLHWDSSLQKCCMLLYVVTNLRVFINYVSERKLAFRSEGWWWKFNHCASIPEHRSKKYGIVVLQFVVYVLKCDLGLLSVAHKLWISKNIVSSIFGCNKDAAGRQFRMSLIEELHTMYRSCSG